MRREIFQELSFLGGKVWAEIGARLRHEHEASDAFKIPPLLSREQTKQLFQPERGLYQEGKKLVGQSMV